MDKNKNIEEILKAVEGLKERFEVDYVKVYFDNRENVCIKLIKDREMIACYRVGKSSFDNKFQKRRRNETIHLTNINNEIGDYNNYGQSKRK